MDRPKEPAAELAGRAVPPSGAAADGAGEARERDSRAGWRHVATGGWGDVAVGGLIKAARGAGTDADAVGGLPSPVGAGDGSDFALVLASLIHGAGGKVRVALVCAMHASASASASARGCRLVAELRVGMGPGAAARWVRRRQRVGAAAGAGLPDDDAERPLHYRRDASGATWLSLAWGGAAASQMPGEPYADDADAGVSSSYLTFTPFDEEGCVWHASSDERDSAGRARGPAPPLSARVGGILTDAGDGDAL